MLKALKSYLCNVGIICLLCLLTSPLTLSAQEVVNIFQVGSDICEPVTLKTSKGDYTFRSSITIYGNISWFEAYDCQGNQIVNPSGSTSTASGQATVRTYVLKTLYESSSSSSSSYSSNTQESSQRVIENTITHVGSSMGRFASSMAYWPAAGYPNLTLNLGASHLFGEFARLKACLGGAGGFILYGGVGKDWIFKGENHEKLSWHCGLGYYGSWGYDSEHEFDMGITFSETPVCPGYALSLDLSYSYFFGDTTRFGLIGGAGIGVGRIKDIFEMQTQDRFAGKFVWDVTLGIAVKLFASSN